MENGLITSYSISFYSATLKRGTKETRFPQRQTLHAKKRKYSQHYKEEKCLLSGLANYFLSFAYQWPETKSEADYV